MKKTIIIFCASILVVFSQLGFAHGFEEARQMLERNLVETDVIVVKFHDAIDVSQITSRTLGFEGENFQVPTRVPYEFARMFRRSEANYKKERAEVEARTGQILSRLENYYYLRLKRWSTFVAKIDILKKLYDSPEVEFAYFEPKTENAVFSGWLGEPLAESEKGRAQTPDFESMQFHLDPAPRGVDARYAWGIEGGTGAGVKVIDVEWGWYNTHEDFETRFWHNNVNYSQQNHGTAVWGEVAAKKDGKGVAGISYGVSFGTEGTRQGAADYEEAAANLSVGDILIIEQHNYGPDNSKFTAMEYWKANFDAFKSITSRGIIVVAAAGNGDSNLDSAAYNGAFDVNVRDSGCILVGAAGAPNSNYHLKRLSFSNYGSRIDAFGYGGNVVTTGYGTLQNGNGVDRDYTNSFSGTSSATPIVAGAVATVSGMAKAKGKTLEPLQIRKALRDTGTTQQGDTSKRIGNLPNIPAVHEYFKLFAE